MRLPIVLAEGHLCVLRHRLAETWAAADAWERHCTRTRTKNPWEREVIELREALETALRALSLSRILTVLDTATQKEPI